MNISRKMVETQRQEIIDRLLDAEINTTHGPTWYDNAHIIARNLGTRYGKETDTVAAIIAALSPMLQWNKNLQCAEAVLHVCSTEPDEGKATEQLYALGMSAFRANINKAVSIYYHGPASVKWGPKTHSFYRNLSGDPDAVTVDRHHAAICLGWDERGSHKMTDAAYSLLADITREAAALRNMTPASFQAALWVTRAQNGGHHA